MLLIWLFVVVFAVVGVAGFLSVGRPSPGPTLPGLGSGLRERIQSAVLPRERKPAVAWEDILGLQDAKQVVVLHMPAITWSRTAGVYNAMCVSS